MSGSRTPALNQNGILQFLQVAQGAAGGGGRSREKENLSSWQKGLVLKCGHSVRVAVNLQKVGREVSEDDKGRKVGGNGYQQRTAKNTMWHSCQDVRIFYE